MEVVIQVACTASWTSIFICQMIVVTDFFICWLEWFDADQAVGGAVTFPLLFLGQPFHRNFISRVLSTDGSYEQDLVQKLFSSIILYIHLQWFGVFSIFAFHVDAAPTWYVILVLSGEGFQWRWLTWVLFA